MTVTDTAIPGVLLFEPRVFKDDRGCFLETFNPKIRDAIGAHSFVQDNESQSKQYVLRGLHYQVRRPQGKLVRVVQGEVFDVAVDLRKSSPTFGKWTASILSGNNKYLLWVPPGFAHGFLTLSSWAVLVYKCTDLYSAQDERTLLWNDPQVRIEWPISGEPLISPKDERGSLLRDAEVYP